MTTERISLEFIALPESSPNIARRVLAAIAAWSQRVKQRNELARFDAHMLQDIGVSHADASLDPLPPFRFPSAFASPGWTSK